MTRSIGQVIRFLLLLPLILAGSCHKQSNPLSLQGMIGKLRSPSASEMVAMAFDPDDPDRRREGVALLSKQDWGLKEPHLKGYALLLNSDDDPSVRSVAVRALGKAGNAKYLPDVINALNDRSPSVRWDAAVALDRLVGEDAINPLRTRALKDESVDVRAACARALRHYRTAQVVHTLKECLADEDFGVRYQAHASLVAAFGRDLGYYPGNWPDTLDGSSTAQAPKKDKKPWWDWFSVTRRSRRSAVGSDSSGKTPQLENAEKSAPASKPTRPDNE